MPVLLLWMEQVRPFVAPLAVIAVMFLVYRKYKSLHQEVSDSFEGMQVQLPYNQLPRATHYGQISGRHALPFWILVFTAAVVPLLVLLELQERKQVARRPLPPLIMPRDTLYLMSDAPLLKAVLVDTRPPQTYLIGWRNGHWMWQRMDTTPAGTNYGDWEEIDWERLRPLWE